MNVQLPLLFSDITLLPSCAISSTSSPSSSIRRSSRSLAMSFVAHPRPSSSPLCARSIALNTSSNSSILWISSTPISSSSPRVNATSIAIRRISPSRVVRISLTRRAAPSSQSEVQLTFLLPPYSLSAAHRRRPVAYLRHRLLQRPASAIVYLHRHTRADSEAFHLVALSGAPKSASPARLLSRLTQPSANRATNILPIAAISLELATPSALTGVWSSSSANP